MELSQADKIIAVGGFIITIITLLQGLSEYSRQGRQRRAQLFIDMRKRFKGNKNFLELCDLLENDDPELKTKSFKDKRELLGFFEEIALMTNSGLIHKEVSGYMFGYYAIKCWESENFWTNVMRSHAAWSLFADYVDQMIRLEEKFKFNRGKFQF